METNQYVFRKNCFFHRLNPTHVQQKVISINISVARSNIVLKTDQHIIITNEKNVDIENQARQILARDSI